MSKKLTIEEIKAFVKENSECELISKEYINSKSNLNFKCSCGNEFKTTFNEFKWNNRRRCEKCSSSVSKMEIDIINLLENHNIEYIHQYKFDECKDKRELPFDFYLPLQNICIEADGKQHFEPVVFGDMTYSDALENLKIVKRHDEFKNKFCEYNNIKLIRIPYWERNNIEKILESIL